MPMDDTRNLIIDPPSGWKYGFPKPYINKEGLSLNEWLVKSGYPKEEIDSYGEYFYCRYWEDRRP